jgi:hypothetical protein
MELVDNPAVIARAQAQHGRAKRNSNGLQSHWRYFLPEARGKHLVVAGLEAFVADTPEKAWAKATAAHPDDDGALGKYVTSKRGPRIYAHRRRVASR